MNPTVRNLLIILVLGVIGASGYFAWHRVMEQVWQVSSKESDAARYNRMLAATMLLRQAGSKVTLAGSLGEVQVDKLPDGTLLLADAAGVMEEAKAKNLLAWVARGNTLLARPRWLSDEEATQVSEELAQVEEDEGYFVPDDEEDEEEEEEADTSGDATGELVESDPIAARLGVRQYFITHAPTCEEGRSSKRCKTVAASKLRPPLRKLTVPGTGHAIELNAGRMKLIGLPNAQEPLWSDEDSNTVRTYQHGKGKIVMMSDDFFSNDELRTHDHGELLLALAALNPSARNVTIVQNLDALPWYQLLWQHFSMVLLAMAALLALLFWTGVRRFGPVLPQPVIERRSLMEHIDAAGAWLWKAKDGRQILLDAARTDTMALMRRRAPALLRLSEHELCAALARQYQIPEEQLAQALHHDAATTSQHFTRQIRILQELRNHYER
jgi:hypothetical protein